MAYLKHLGIPTFDVNVVFTNINVEEGSDEKLSFPWISAAEIEGKQSEPTIKELKVFITWYLQNSDRVSTSWEKIRISFNGNIINDNDTKLIKDKTYIATLLASGGKRKRKRKTRKGRRRRKTRRRRRRKTRRRRRSKRR